MSFVLGAISAAWIAGLAAGLAALLPAASVARLLPRRWARAEALVWLAVVLVQLLAVVAAFAAVPNWATRPLQYTPHLERPLTHLCFLHLAHSLLGVEFLRGGSIVMTVLMLLGITRLCIGAVTAHRRLTQITNNSEVLYNPFSDRAFIAEVSLPATVGLCRPVVVLSHRALDLPPEPLGAILAHEAAHARWRDPLVGLVVEAAAWVWPLPGIVVAGMWRRAAERAADNEASARASARAWTAARSFYGVKDEDNTDSLKRPEGKGPALAAAAAWAILFVALGRLLGQPAVMTVVCAFEAFGSAWR